MLVVNNIKFCLKWGSPINVKRNIYDNSFKILDYLFLYDKLELILCICNSVNGARGLFGMHGSMAHVRCTQYI